MKAGALIGLLLVSLAWGQSDENRTSAPEKKHGPGAAHDIGSGAGNIGTGAAKGAGNLAKGTAKGAGDLVTLHPIDAGAAIGKGAVGAGKDVAVGTTKGTGKIARGIGKTFKKIL